LFSSRRRHTSSKRDWSSDVCSSDLFQVAFRFKFVNVEERHLLILIRTISILLETCVIHCKASSLGKRGRSEDGVRETWRNGNRRSEERRVGKEWRSRGAEWR